MKIYQIRAKRGKLKYHEEHIHFLLDGTDDYNWRLVLSEINQKSNLTLPEKLEFITDKIEFKKLSESNWLKCDFKLPIINKKFLEFLTQNNKFDFQFFPVKIIDKKNTNLVNEDFLAFYLCETFDCLDKELTSRLDNNVAMFDFKNGVYKNEIDYPILFKIEGMPILNIHYCNEIGKNKLMKFAEQSFDFYELSEINI